MDYVLTRRKDFPDITANLDSPKQLDLEYLVLDPDDAELMVDAADCLADTFAGTDVGGKKIVEPLIYALDFKQEYMFDYVMEYLKTYANQGLCFIAKDNATNRVVGVVACESFDPEEEIVEFEGNIEPINKIVDFLLDLDERFVESINIKTGIEVKKDHLVHAFLAGSRLAKFKSYVVAKLVELIMEEGKDRGFKGIFAECTSERSAKLLIKYHGYRTVEDKNGDVILKEYKTSDIFNRIPEEMAKACRILYKPFSADFEI